jgi:hypothetical protein
LIGIGEIVDEDEGDLFGSGDHADDGEGLAVLELEWKQAPAVFGTC